MHPSNVGFLATAVYEGYYVLNGCRLFHSFLCGYLVSANMGKQPFLSGLIEIEEKCDVT